MAWETAEGSTSPTTGYGSATATVHAKNDVGDNGYYVKVYARGRLRGLEVHVRGRRAHVRAHRSRRSRRARLRRDTERRAWEVNTSAVGGTPEYVTITNCHEKAWALDPCTTNVVDL